MTLHLDRTALHRASKPTPSHRLLIIDDEPVTLHNLRSLLEDHYQVETLPTATAARALGRSKNGRVSSDYV